MIVFRNLEISVPFRYLWFKYITGINLNVHCANAFKGDYSKLIGTATTAAEEIVFDEFEANVFYLCGVSKPYNWEKNFHLAMIAAEGEKFSFDEFGIRADVEGARRIKITSGAMNEINHPKIVQKAFNTCRNWQFANWLELQGNIFE